MKAKKYMVLFLLIITLVATASCSEEKTDNKVSGNKDAKAEIKIDVMENENYLLGAINKFNETHKTLKIIYNAVKYDEEYINKYITGLTAGDGPDIIRIEPWLFPAANKVANSGLLYDMNILISKDKEFKLSDYNQKVLESGVIKGKRILIPLGYNFSVFYAKNEALRENGIITEGSKWTLGYLADEAFKYTQKNKDIGKSFMAQNNFTFSDIVKSSGLNFIDQEKKESNFNSPEFIDLLNIYKKMTSTVKQRGDISTFAYSSGDLVEFTTSCPELDNGTALIVSNKYGGALWFKDGLNKKMNVYLFPQYTSEKSILIETMLSFAINSKSSYKNEAYEFLKLLLSEEYQSNGRMERNFPYIPVNNNAYLNNANFYISNLSNTQAFNGEYDAEKRKAQVKAQLKEIESISRCDTLDAQVYDIIDKAVNSFIGGKNTAEQTGEIIQNKVTLYLNE